ncbi:hypothetical protein HRbin36_02648 [bacterium HR36]|nr:hypothetical protein HRbin36_02648 [bacterium HR36]
MIGNLVKLTAGPGTFTVQTTQHQVHLLQGAEDLLQLLGQRQGWQVEQHTGAHACTHVGRAGREITKFFTEGVANVFGQGVIEGVDVVPGFFQLEATANHLNAEMVFLIDHDGTGFVVANGHAALPVGVGVLATDELAFHQELAIQFGEFVHGKVRELPTPIQLLDAFT